MLAGAASPLGIRVNNRYYTASWEVTHVSLAALTAILVVSIPMPAFRAVQG